MPEPSDRAHRSPKKQVPIYKDQLKGRLRFPLHALFKSILDHWVLSLAQFAPNTIRQIYGFIIYCKYLDTKPFLLLFRYFFLIQAISKNSRQ